MIDRHWNPYAQIAEEELNAMPHQHARHLIARQGSGISETGRYYGVGSDAAQVEAGENPWNTIVPSKVTAEQIETTVPVRGLVESFLNASVVLVVAVDLKVVASFDQHLDRVGVISGASVYPFVWNVLLAARQAGFGGTITTLAVAQEPEIQALLGIPRDYAVCALVPLGRPTRQLRKLRRRSVEEIATRERFDGMPFSAE